MTQFAKQLVKTVSEDNNLEPSESEFALNYLDFYYVPKTIGKQTKMAQADIPALIRKFQKTFGLKVNGKLDAQTVRAMKWPRCGCPDYQTIRAQNSRAAKWGNKRLTYFVEKYVPGISKADHDDIIELAYQQWEDHCELDITRVTSKNNANMIISTGSGKGDNFDGPGGTLAWAYLPPNSNYNGQLLMRFDLGETWIVNPRDRGIMLLNVACHEFGHFLGLDHSKSQRALMAPFYSPEITGPQANDDIPRIQQLYGQPKTPAPTPDRPTPGQPTPSPGKHKIEITGITNLGQVKVDGKPIADFTLI
jgi:hypothetical protein